MLFATQERLTPDDQDNSQDIYLRDLADNTTTLVSKGDGSCASEGCGKGEFTANFAPGGTAADGTKVFFVTAERLSSDDHDSAFDIYVRDLTREQHVPGLGGRFLLLGEQLRKRGISRPCSSTRRRTGRRRSSPPTRASSPRTPTAKRTSTSATSKRGPRHWSLPSAPVRTASTAVRRSAEPPATERTSSSRPTTASPAADTDEESDVYDWSGGAPALVSTGPGGRQRTYNVDLRGQFGRRKRRLLRNKRTARRRRYRRRQDVYSRSGGATSLVSTGPAGGNGPVAAEFRWASPDDSTSAVIFSTAEALTSEDTDEAQDIYIRNGVTTTLLSTGPQGGNGTAEALFGRHRTTDRASSSSRPNRWSPRTLIRAVTYTKGQGTRQR